MQQRTEEWLDSRSGHITASAAKLLVTSRGEKTSGATRESHIYHLAAERVAMKALDVWDGTAAMKIGTEREAAAREMFCSIMDVEIEEVGFIKMDGHIIGCSPDGIFNDTGLEIKSPKAATHAKYIVKNKLPTEYIVQVQLTMAVLNLNEYYFMSYHPDLQPFIKRVKRDNKFIDKALPVLFADEELIIATSETIENREIFNDV
ncbi:MAG: lambda exonuclease family protein [Burkholderiales bacterium]